MGVLPVSEIWMVEPSILDGDCFIRFEIELSLYFFRRRRTLSYNNYDSSPPTCWCFLYTINCPWDKYVSYLDNNIFDINLCKEIQYILYYRDENIEMNTLLKYFVKKQKTFLGYLRKRQFFCLFFRCFNIMFISKSFLLIKIFLKFLSEKAH
jgi:hypothetical protein